MKLKRKISLLLAMCMSTACAASTAVFADEEGAPSEPAATVIDFGQNMQFDALKITYSGTAPTEDTAIKVGRKNYTVKAGEQRSMLMLRIIPLPIRLLSRAIIRTMLR